MRRSDVLIAFHLNEANGTEENRTESEGTEMHGNALKRKDFDQTCHGKGNNQMKILVAVMALLVTSTAVAETDWAKWEAARKKRELVKRERTLRSIEQRYKRKNAGGEAWRRQVAAVEAHRQADRKNAMIALTPKVSPVYRMWRSLRSTTWVRSHMRRTPSGGYTRVRGHWRSN